MSRKAAAKKKPKPAAKKPGTKAKPVKTLPKPRAAKPKRQTVYVVSRKIYGVYGDAQYTRPDRVFATAEAARRHAEALNGELVALGAPFEHYNPAGLIKGGEKALLALVEKTGLPGPTKPAPFGRGLDWTGWWNANYFNMTDGRRAELCRAFDGFGWYEVRTTTLE